MRIRNGRTRAALTTTTIAVSVALLGAAPAFAQESEPVDPAQGRGTLGQITGPYLCDPEDSPFRQTQECEVDHDDNVWTPTVNPYTGTIDSPGLLGEDGIGGLAPLGLDELL